MPPASPLDAFHPTLRSWFTERVGEPSAPQARGWPLIRAGHHTLIAAPTGSGKTLAAFLYAMDSLLQAGDELADETRVLYVSPLKALGNDVQKNLQAPLAELRERDPNLADVRVLVRSGDTPQKDRAKMLREPPHILVTTPESLYILLTSEGGRGLLKSVRSVIVDEIHAVLGDKRGAHLALSLERLDALTGGVQRIGLSATQKPLERVGRFLGGAGREVELVDEGHLREMDVAVELPGSPLETVCSHEVWAEIYDRVSALVREHRTTLIFVGTRKMAERAAAQLAKQLGEELVTCHHSSLSKERRLDAEERLKAGKLRALVATASLELGIDIGDIDLVVQLGETRSIATFLQRVGRAGHGIGRTPKGRLFPLTQDELVEAAALLRAVGRGLLDVTPEPHLPLDILAQQIVAECVHDAWDEDELFAAMRRAWPYRELDRATFDKAVALHTKGRLALLHRDGVNGRLRATRRAKLVAVTSGGAIPDNANYRVVLEPEGTVVGSVDEDFAVESSAGDIFQLGNTSWRVLKLEQGTMRVADAAGIPPSLPFWFGEAPSRTTELSGEIGDVRAGGIDATWLVAECGFSSAAAEQLSEYLGEGAQALGAVPKRDCIVAERFFDESGGMQLVVHAPYGSRINRAFGLALRKRFCRRFGFELQAAANEEAIVLSLGPVHSFPLEEIFDYLRADTVRDVLIQAVLPTPLFSTRWRWNVSRALLVPRMQSGKRVAPPLLRMRADDLLAEAFPEAVACGENLPGGDLPVPMDHPLVAQTIEDCLTQAMDVDGLCELLKGLESGSIARHVIDRPSPSPFAKGILSARPYSFLDDAPLEERRTQAVLQRRVLDERTSDELGALDPAAVERVREEAWPDPRSAEEVHESLLWMGYVTREEAQPWSAWIDELSAAGRIVLEGERWFAVEATRDAKEVLRGRMEALGPVFLDDPLLFELEREGVLLRTRLDGREAWCDRRLLARIQRYTLEKLRADIQPVSAAEFWSFLLAWQCVAPEFQHEGPAGVLAVATQLAGFEIPVRAWEREILPARVRGYRRDWLDQMSLSGQVAWGRLWGAGTGAVKAMPVALVPRAELDDWTALAGAADAQLLGGQARALLDGLREHGASFHQELEKRAKLLPTQLEAALGELITRGLVTADSYAPLRWLATPGHKRRQPPIIAGRWSAFRSEVPDAPPVEFFARALLRRYGVVFRRMLEREHPAFTWRELLRAYRTLELRGEIRGGRFVAGFAGEQYAEPGAVTTLRRLRRKGFPAPAEVSPADPLNLQGILTPDARVASTRLGKIRVGVETEPPVASS